MAELPLVVAFVRNQSPCSLAPTAEKCRLCVPPIEVTSCLEPLAGRSGVLEPGGSSPLSKSASTCSFEASLRVEKIGENPETVGMTCQKKQGLPSLSVSDQRLTFQSFDTLM